MIRTIIVEDEPEQAEGLALLLQRFCPNIEIIANAGDKNEAIEVIAGLHPDLVFLDIRLMDDKEAGFGILAAVELIDFEVIILSSYTEFALRAVNLKRKVIHFLQKPVQIEETIVAVQKVADRLQAKANADNQKAGQSRIALPNAHGMDLVPLHQIIRCEADTWLTKVYINGKAQPMLVSRNLGWFIEHLPPENFIRVHNSHLVNFEFVAAYSTKEGPALCIVNSSETVPIGPKFKDSVMEKISNSSRFTTRRL